MGNDHIGKPTNNRSVRPSTMGRRLAAIRYAHKLAGLEPPTYSETVKATLRGIRRTAGSTLMRVMQKCFVITLEMGYCSFIAAYAGLT
jgi:hypothetical protein